MNVIYLTQVFEVGQDPGSERHFFFCKYLVRRGHTVTAITSNVDYKRATVKYPGGGWRVQRQVEGVNIEYVYSFARFRGSFLRRFWYYLTYFFVVGLAGLYVRRPDVIYAVSTPLTVGLLGYLLSRLRGVPFVFEVTDVWPDAAVAVGVVKNRFLIEAARWLERFCYRKAARIVALTEGIRANIIGKGVSPDKVVLITNGVDPTLFAARPEAAETRTRLRQTYGWEEAFVAMYLGAHGAYNALGTLLEVATLRQADPRLCVVLVGDGDAKPRLQAQAQAEQLTNVVFLPPVAREEAAALLSSADVFLLPNRRGEFYTMNLPNKLFDFLASGRPILVAGHGETGNLVERAGAGRVVPAEDAPAMAAALQALQSLSAAERAAMGEAGRRYVLEHYNREQLSQRFLDVLNHALRRPDSV